MAKCKECKFYIEKDETRGECLGREISANNEVSKCPIRAFRPRK